MDKQVAMSTLNQKPSRHELETVLNSKAEILEVQQMLQTLELKFEDEFANINEQIARRACLDDLNFVRQELSYKADKESFDELSHELHDKMQSCLASMSMQEQALAQRADFLDQKLEERFSEIRSKLNSRLDELSNGRQKELIGKIL